MRRLNSLAPALVAAALLLPAIATAQQVDPAVETQLLASSFQTFQAALGLYMRKQAAAIADLQRQLRDAAAQKNRPAVKPGAKH